MRNILHYPVVIHKDPGSDYGVTVPDLPGCFSAGSTVDEALTMAKEAIELHLEGLAADGESIPRPKPIGRRMRQPEYKSGAWAFVSIDAGNLPGKAVRINITLSERVLRKVDRFAEAAGETRSGLLAEAATQYVKARTHSGKVKR
jgi:predicted RNase H-like HicB family nuclease